MKASEDLEPFEKNQLNLDLYAVFTYMYTYILYIIYIYILYDM